MPQVTVYIREDDLDKWKAIEKKSEFIHSAIVNKWQTTEKNQATTAVDSASPIKAGVTKPKPPSPNTVIKTKEDVEKIVPQFIDKKFSARRKGSRETHVDLGL